ncbi:MAG: ATP-dependent Clp protease adaptor ClpS [Flavobacteriales bacterium]
MNKPHVQPDRIREIDTILKEQTGKNCQITIYNDDFNTFEFVIETLIEVCDHSPEQAEQCTWIIHFKGKCEVKSGTIEKLYPMYKELLYRGLTAELSS